MEKDEWSCSVGEGVVDILALVGGKTGGMLGLSIPEDVWDKISRYYTRMSNRGRWNAGKPAWRKSFASKGAEWELVASRFGAGKSGMTKKEKHMVHLTCVSTDGVKVGFAYMRRREFDVIVGWVPDARRIMESI